MLDPDLREASPLTPAEVLNLTGFASDLSTGPETPEGRLIIRFGLCREIAKAHGGDVHVQSDQAGTKAVLRLRLDLEAPITSAQEPVAA